MKFRISNGVYSFRHIRTGVEWTWTNPDIWHGLMLWAKAHSVTLTEAVLIYERS